METSKEIGIRCDACGREDSIDVAAAVASGDPVAIAAVNGSVDALRSVAREAWGDWTTTKVKGGLVNICPGCEAGFSAREIA